MVTADSWFMTLSQFRHLILSLVLTMHLWVSMSNQSIISSKLESDNFHRIAYCWEHVCLHNGGWQSAGWFGLNLHLLESQATCLGFSLEFSALSKRIMGENLTCSSAWLVIPMVSKLAANNLVSFGVLGRDLPAAHRIHRDCKWSKRYVKRRRLVTTSKLRAEAQLTDASGTSLR